MTMYEWPKDWPAGVVRPYTVTACRVTDLELRVARWLGWWDNRAGTIPRSRLAEPVTPQHLPSKEN